MIRITWLVISLVCTPTVWAAEQSIHDRMTHHRAIDAVVWAMPLMNFKFYRDALADVGVRPNDLGYFSKLQDWRFQTATPNNTTPYNMTYWNFEDGPVVVEIPLRRRESESSGPSWTPGNGRSRMWVPWAVMRAAERSI